MTPELNRYKPICSAITKLLPGLVEVVLHDLGSGKIAHIENSFSPRVAGDISLVETKDYKSETSSDKTVGPYSKSNSDGARRKSVSAVLQAADGRDIGLLCINMRIDALESAQAALAAIAGVSEANPSSGLVKNDWREIANTVIADQIQTLGISIVGARRDDRLAIVNALSRAAVFEARGAIDYVASALGISRAGLYDLLKTLREEPPKLTAAG